MMARLNLPLRCLGDYRCHQAGVPVQRLYSASPVHLTIITLLAKCK